MLTLLLFAQVIQLICHQYYGPKWCCCCSVAKLCLTLCDPMNCSMPGSSVLFYLLEFAQIHVHWVGDDIQPSHPLSSVQFSRVPLFVTPWVAARQASLSITISQSSLRLTSIKSSSHLILSHPLLLLPPIPPSISLFQWVNSSHEVAKVLDFQLQHHSFQRNPRADLLQNGLIGSPCSPKDSQESSPTPQFKSIISSVLSFLHSPTLTSIHDHRKNHSLD